jgi:hypothetical protein
MATQHNIEQQQQQTPSSTSLGFFQAYINNTLFPVLIVAKIVRIVLFLSRLKHTNKCLPAQNKTLSNKKIFFISNVKYSYVQYLLNVLIFSKK